MKEFMGNWLDKIIKGAAAVGGFLAGLYGGWGGMLTVLLIVMVVDYLSGVAVAVMNKSLKTEGGGLNSKVGARGILKKGLIMLVVLLGATLDKALGGGQAMFRDMAVYFYIANEGLSILENMAVADLPLPEKFKDVLEQWKEKGNKTEE